MRKKICDPLERFFIDLNASDSIADMCRALYRYMEESELRKKTLELAQRELSYGNKKTASEEAAFKLFNYGINSSFFIHS